MASQANPEQPIRQKLRFILSSFLSLSQWQWFTRSYPVLPLGSVWSMLASLHHTQPSWRKPPWFVTYTHYCSILLNVLIVRSCLLYDLFSMPHSRGFFKIQNVTSLLTPQFPRHIVDISYCGMPGSSQMPWPHLLSLPHLPCSSPGGSGQTINGLVCPYFGLSLVGGGDQSIALLGRDSLIGTVHKKQLRERCEKYLGKI